MRLLSRWTSSLVLLVLHSLCLQTPTYAHVPLQNRLDRNLQSRRLIAQGLPAAPTFSPAYGLYTSSVNVTISAAAGNIFYTLDGSQPTSASTPFTGGTITCTSDTQINAIAVVGGTSSPVATGWFAVDYNAAQVSTSNIALWLRSDFGVIPSAGALSNWGDISLNERDASATSPHQPSVQANSINNLPAVTFASGGSGQFVSVPGSVSNFSSGISIFVIARPTTLSSGAQLLSLGSTGGLNSSISLSENASLQPTFSVYNSAGTVSNVASSTIFDTNQFHLYEVVQSGTTATMFLDGLQVSQNSSMNSLPTSTYSSNYIGQLTTGGNFYSGQIAEVVIYNTALTQSQRSALESYFNFKYQFSRVATAPIISVPTGTLSGPTQVAIAAPADETVYFTTDGTSPSSTNGSLYNGPIDVYYTETVKAIGVSGANQSTISSATYTLDSSLYPAPGPGGVPLQINLTLPSTAIP